MGKETEMARGWESKAVEQQVEEAGAQSALGSAAGAPQEQAPAEPPHEDPEHRHRVQSLTLVRSQVREQLENARTVSQRQMLQQRLRAIEADLEAVRNGH